MTVQNGTYSLARRRQWSLAFPPWAVTLAVGAALVAFAVVDRLAGGRALVRVIAYEIVATLLLLLARRVFPSRELGRHLERLTLYRACAAFWMAGVAWDVVTLDILPLPEGADGPWPRVLLFLPAYVLIATYGAAQAFTGGFWQGLDVLVVVVAGASGAYAAFLAPLVASGGSLTPRAVSAAVTVVTSTVLGAALVAARRDWASWLVLGAMAAGFAANQLETVPAQAGTAAPGGAADVLRLVQYAVLVASLATPVPEYGDRPGITLPRSRIAVLGACTLALPAWLSVASFTSAGRSDGAGVLAVATAVVTALVTIRLTALTLMHERLAARLAGSLHEREQMQEALERQVMVDTLTALPNRYAFRKATEATAGHRSGCVMFIDLDDFKLVNDTRGHQAGDDLLVQLAGRLQQVVRGDDLVARLGGDEFAVLLPDSSVDAARQRAVRIIDSLTRDVHLADGGSPVRVGASVGVAELTEDPDKSLGAADMAMYAAKQAGKGTVAVFDEGMREALQKEARFASDFETALGDGALESAFQPVIDLRDPSYIGFEALVRWRRDGRSVPPDVFLPVAAQRNLAPAVDILMLHKALNAVRMWRLDGFEVTVFVNVSAQLALHPDFTDLVLGVLARYSVPGPRLVLEMTEQVVIDDTAAVAGKLRSLRDRGVRIALDDFGTGYSSLAYLQELPVDILKLDKALVRRGTADTESSDLLKSVIGIGHSLGMHVTAEGIETSQQATVITNLGCDFGQGWLWGAALDHHQTHQYLIRTHTARLMDRFYGPYSGTGGSAVLSVPQAPVPGPRSGETAEARYPPRRSLRGH
jgi:diguanylate cyclase (GGDEF)-like protein